MQKKDKTIQLHVLTISNAQRAPVPDIIPPSLISLGLLLTKYPLQQLYKHLHP
jgi:hypothetical protein